MKKICLLALAALFCSSVSYGQILKSSTMVVEKKQKKETRYQGELNFGYGLGGNVKVDGEKYDAKFSRAFIETVHGMRINEYAFAGLGFGFQYAYDDENFNREGIGMIPLFLDLKGYYPVTDSFAPYVAIDLGYGLPIIGTETDYSELKGGFYASYGIGLNYKKLNFGLGWQHQGFKYGEGDGFGVNSFFVKIGLNF